MKFYKNLSDLKKSLLVGIILIGVLFTAIFINAKIRKQKLDSDFILTQGTITEIKFNAPKSGIQTKHIFKFKFEYKGKIILKVRETYKPELLKVGQKFKLKVHSKNSDLLEFDLDGA